MGLEILILSTSIHHHDIKDQGLSAIQMVLLLFLFHCPIIKFNRQFHLLCILWCLHHIWQFLGTHTSHSLDLFQLLKLLWQNLDLRHKCKLLCHQLSLHHEGTQMFILSTFLVEDLIHKKLPATGIIIGIINDHLVQETAYPCNRVLDQGHSLDLSFLLHHLGSWLDRVSLVTIPFASVHCLGLYVNSHLRNEFFVCVFYCKVFCSSISCYVSSWRAVHAIYVCI